MIVGQTIEHPKCSMDTTLRRLEQEHQSNPFDVDLTKKYYSGLKRAGLWPPKIWFTFTKNETISTTSTSFVTTSARLCIPEELAGTKWNILYLAFPRLERHGFQYGEYRGGSLFWPDSSSSIEHRIEIAMSIDAQETHHRSLYFVHSVPSLQQTTFTAISPINRELEIFWRVTAGTGYLAHQLLRIDLLE